MPAFTQYELYILEVKHCRGEPLQANAVVHEELTDLIIVIKKFHYNV